MSIFDEFEEKRKILNLQKAYESGIIREEELSEKQKAELMKLYNEQITSLEYDAIMYKRKLQMYKQKIIEKRKKIQISLDKRKKIV